MPLPTKREDYWTLASESDKLKALAALSSLPARGAISGELDDASFVVALDRVTRYGLLEAVRLILQGKLGHAFFPSPPELRLQCDKAMEWPERQRERQEREGRYNRERRENDMLTPRTAEAIARQQAAYRKFLAGYEDGKKAADVAERAEIRARYGMTDEVVAAIPDQLVGSANYFMDISHGRKVA